MSSKKGRRAQTLHSLASLALRRDWGTPAYQYVTLVLKGPGEAEAVQSRCL